MTVAPLLTEGQRVRVTQREITPEDTKTGSLYDYMRGLTGTIQKVYGTGQVGVEIDLEALPSTIRERHTGVQEAMRTRWMDGLSEDAKNRLTEPEKIFRLRYTLLLNNADVEPYDGPPAQPRELPTFQAPAMLGSAIAPVEAEEVVEEEAELELLPYDEPTA